MYKQSEISFFEIPLNSMGQQISVIPWLGNGKEEPHETLISASLSTSFHLSLVDALHVPGSCVQEDRLVSVFSLVL